MALSRISKPTAKAMRTKYKNRGGRGPPAAQIVPLQRKAQRASRSRRNKEAIRKKGSKASPRKEQASRPQHRPSHAKLDFSVAAGQPFPLDKARIALDQLLTSPIPYVPATKRTLSLSARNTRPKMASQAAQQIRAMLPDYPTGMPLMDKGLPNRGNYCYRNSVVQSLMHVPKVLCYIEAHKNLHAVSQSGCIVCLLRTLLNNYWLPLNDTKLRSVILHFDTWINSNTNFMNFNNHDQQDAGEFYDIFMNYLHDPQQSPLPADEVRALFGMLVGTMSVFKTNDCDHSSLACQPWDVAGISLNILHPRPNLSFNDYLNICFNDDNVFTKTCETCDRKGPGTMIKRIFDAPEVLKINIGRVNMSSTGRLYIVSNHVDTPLYLDLSRFAADEADQAPGTLYYKLQCVIYHEGVNNPHRGHYTATVTTPTGVKYMSDLSIQRWALRDMLHGNASRKPFMLFYQRLRPDEDSNPAAQSYQGPQ